MKIEKIPLSVLFSLVFCEQLLEKIHITMYYNTTILVVGKFRSFEVVSYSLCIISGCFLLVVGCFWSFLVRCRSSQVVSCSLQVVSGRFLLVVGLFRLFQVVPRCSKYQKKSFEKSLAYFPNFKRKINLSK